MAGGQSSDVSEGTKFNKEMINGPEGKHPKPEKVGKRLLLIFILLLVLGSILGGVSWLIAKGKDKPVIQAPAPKPTTTSIKIEGGEDLKDLVYGNDYSVSTSGRNYLINVIKSPKRLIYNGTEVYKGEDMTASALSADGKHWALQTSRQEQRSKRDENTKILQETIVSVSTYTVDGQEWGEEDNTRLVGLTNDAEPVYIQETGKQTPSQYGDALGEEILYSGKSEVFKTSYGILTYEMDGEGKNWLVTTNNPSTKEVVDFYVNGAKKDALDARILKRVNINSNGDYLLAFCQESAADLGINLIGKDCQISVNSKTRTTISGTVFLANTLGGEETYAGIDKELKQGFSKNSRVDLALEHRKDLEADPATGLAVYLNETGDKYAITSSRILSSGKLRFNLSINSNAVENTVSTASLFEFGSGADAATLFIYELPS